MSPLMILLIAIVVLIVVILLLVFSIYYKFKKTLGISNFNSFLDEVKQNDRNNYSSKKSISGMTRILEPLIIKDFPDFNLSHLYSSIETNLSSILNAKTKLDPSLLNKGFPEEDNEQIHLLPVLLSRCDRLRFLCKRGHNNNDLLHGQGLSASPLRSVFH